MYDVARCLSLLLCSWACRLTYCLVSSIELSHASWSPDLWAKLIWQQCEYDEYVYSCEERRSTLEVINLLPCLAGVKNCVLM